MSDLKKNRTARPALPIMLRPAAGHALVVGGGPVALRKTRGLVEAGFTVRVVAPDLLPDFSGLEGVTLVREAFAPDRIDRPALVFACTNRREVNEAVGRAARERGIPVLVADREEESTFISPAVIRHGGLTAAVSTGGTDPGRARALREELAAWLAKQAGPGEGAGDG